MKPHVECVRKKLDNAVEIMCSLRLSLETTMCVKLDKWHSAFVTSSHRQTKKKGNPVEGRLKLHQSRIIVLQFSLVKADSLGGGEGVRVSRLTDLTDGL